jgi:cell division protein FtsQ
VLNVPVSQVNVEGEFRYLSQEEVHHVINTYVVNGFITVDLKKLRAELLQLPWIYKASVKRQLPDGLLVTLVEQKPVAFWNNDGMINDSGEVFFPSKMIDIPGMPRLYGKNHQDVLAFYGDLQKQLPLEHQPVSSLNVSESNVVHATLKPGAVLVFNKADMLEKIKIWKSISASELGNRLNEVEYVDLRYSNGAAVKWKAFDQVNSKNMASGTKNGK